ncbi:MAG: hypothetical protein PHF00_03285 [Elusimicrobia bacterium]|nr:hypothetical protein [Elusimicrobiota bacterium]
MKPRGSARKALCLLWSALLAAGVFSQCRAGMRAATAGRAGAPAWGFAPVSGAWAEAIGRSLSLPGLSPRWDVLRERLAPAPVVSVLADTGYSPELFLALGEDRAAVMNNAVLNAAGRIQVRARRLIAEAASAEDIADISEGLEAFSGYLEPGVLRVLVRESWLRQRLLGIAEGLGRSVEISGEIGAAEPRAEAGIGSVMGAWDQGPAPRAWAAVMAGGEKFVGGVALLSLPKRAQGEPAVRRTRAVPPASFSAQARGHATSVWSGSSGRWATGLAAARQAAPRAAAAVAIFTVIFGVMALPAAALAAGIATAGGAAAGLSLPLLAPLAAPWGLPLAALLGLFALVLGLAALPGPAGVILAGVGAALGRGIFGAGLAEGAAAAAAAVAAEVPLSKAGPERLHAYFKELIIGLGYVFDTQPLRLNLLGVRGLWHGQKVANRFNLYNDTIFAIWIDAQNKPQVMCLDASCDPGLQKAKDKPNPKGIAHLVEGQYFFERGLHQGKYRALRQAVPVKVKRYFDDAPDRVKELIDFGDFGINIHAGGARAEVNNWSAGCQVICGTTAGEPWKKFDRLVYKTADQGQKRIPYVLVSGEALKGWA